MTKTDPSKLTDERIALLYHVSQAFNSTLELDEVLNIVIDEVIAAIQAERGFVVLRESDGELVFRAARGMDKTTVYDPQFQISHGVIGEVANRGQPILTSDAQHDDRFSARDSVTDLGLRSIMCAPLKVKEQLLGAIYVDNRLMAGIFNQDDLDLLSAIASSAAIAIENARLYQLAVEKGRLERELQLAYKVQSSLIPQKMPQVSGWDLAARWLPAREVAGDFFDFIHLNEGELGLAIADVVDMGMSAALFMAFSRSIIRASVLRGMTAKDGIVEANKLICEDPVYGMFLTLVYGTIQSGSGDLTYVNAGHNPPLLCCADQDKLCELTRTGMLLGVDETTSYQQETINLKSGDFILFYTDGVCDAINPQGEEFGLECMRRLLPENRQKPAEEIVSEVVDSIVTYTQSEDQYDDITILAAKRV
jgi:sigma-B regulation protein RsbU (phosphoserine phosphatase)